jgi:hypothetical protein
MRLMPGPAEPSEAQIWHVISLGYLTLVFKGLVRSGFQTRISATATATITANQKMSDNLTRLRSLVAIGQVAVSDWLRLVKVLTGCNRITTG